MHSCQPTEACLAAFLAAAKPYMYIYCQWDHGEDLLAETTFPDMDNLLGDPESDAVQIEPHVWRRRFGGSNGTANMTVVFWDNIKKTGNISWAGVLPPPPPPPPPPGAAVRPGDLPEQHCVRRWPRPRRGPGCERGGMLHQVRRGRGAGLPLVLVRSGRLARAFSKRTTATRSSARV